jgi:hypothetical protein
MAYQKRHDEKEQSARKDIERLREERDLFSGLFRRTFAHFSAADAGEDDPIERWGRRIGRALSAVAFVALCVYLYVTHFR